VHADEVEVKADTAAKWTRYTAKEVKYFELDTLTYEPRVPKGGDVSIKPRAVFMEVVVKTKDGLNMYIEHYQQPAGNRDVLTIYVSIPGNAEEAYDLNSFKFIPKFDNKVSKIVAACPALAEKIDKKEKGYFYNMMNQQKAPDIWADIILEYKKCIGN
jgi:hypothetical protein